MKAVDSILDVRRVENYSLMRSIICIDIVLRILENKTEATNSRLVLIGVTAQLQVVSGSIPMQATSFFSVAKYI